MKTTHLAVGAAVMAAMLTTGTASAADNQIRPYFGATFGGGTTFVDLEKAAGKPNKVVGVSVVTLGEMLGGEVDLGDAPGFFQAGDQHLVLSSRVTTLMGNVVIAAPRKLTEYSLRPYIVGGGGLMRARIDDYFGVLKVARVLPGFDVGAGALGFLTKDVGICWDVRRFQSLSRSSAESGVTFGKEKLSFWRASMGLAIRY